MAFYYNAHVDWFHKYLGGDPPLWNVTEHARNRAFPEPESSDEGVEP